MKVKAPAQKHVFASMKKAWMLNRQAWYQVQTNFAERETFMNQVEENSSRKLELEAREREPKQTK